MIISQSKLKTSWVDVGGAGLVTFWFTKVFVIDFAVKVAIGAGIVATTWGSTADNAAINVVKLGTAILQSPGNKLKNFYKKLRGIDPEHSQNIQEILLDKNLSITKKLELVRIKVEQIAKNLKGVKRKKFILFVMTTLIFLFGLLTGNIGVFAVIIESLRALIKMNRKEGFIGAFIDVYCEYNVSIMYLILLAWKVIRKHSIRL